MEFVKWPKIPRLNRDVIITEKIDGTNTHIYIEHNTLVDEWIVGPETADMVTERTLAHNDTFRMFAGSRKRYVTPNKDNFGFAKWAAENSDELFKLGPGRHYGEWWGQGIQRNYGLKERRFSLFNVSKYNTDYGLPECVSVVPELYEGPFETTAFKAAIEVLNFSGSAAAPGFMKPEGIVVFHVAGNHTYKVMCEGDDTHKGE